MLPKSLKQLVYKELQDKMGHLGPERVQSLARERMYWPRMLTDITNYIQQPMLMPKTKETCQHQSTDAGNHNIIPRRVSQH